MNGDTDVLVVGGGVIGLCSAYYLAEQGRRVSIVEQGEIGSGCSGANAGLIVPSHSIPLAAPGALGQGLKWMLQPDSPFYIKPRLNPALCSWLWKFRRACKPQNMHQGLRVLRDLNYASSELFEHLLVSESLTCGYRQDGWLMTYNTERVFQKAVEEARLLQSYDVGLKILKADEALEMEPTLRPEICGGIFFQDDAHLNPEKFVQALARRLSVKGVAIHPHTGALEFTSSGGSITTVRTTGGDFRAKHVVLAAGAWSVGLVRNLGLSLPVQPAKGYSISIKKPEPCPQIPLYLSEVKVAVTPLEDVLRFAGKLELVGMDLDINPRRVDAIINAPKEYLQNIEYPDTMEIWRGLRPCSPDGLPIIDRLPGYDNLIMATGHCMLGVTLAPITGKLVSQLVCGQAPAIDLAPFRMARFK